MSEVEQVIDDVLDELDGARLLAQVEGFLGGFVAFPSEAARVAVVLWAAHAHLVDDIDSTPRLALLSPEPGSGKTRTLEVLELLVPRPMAALNASPAPIFRSIESARPTLLFDEVDALFGRHVKSDDPAADLRALLNAGHRRGASIPRCVGPRHDVEQFPVFAAAALAGLGDLPETLMSRSVIIRMRRRAPAERVQPFRRRVYAAEGDGLRQRLAAWASAVSGCVSDAWPQMPPGVEDRPADVWEPLLAVADAAGGDWPARGRSACIELCAVAATRDASLGVRLLGDLRDLFAAAGQPDAMPTEAILTELCKLDEAPWGDLHGKPLDARGLARRLRQYDIGSVKVKAEGRSLQGYRREHLWDAWQRYLPSVPEVPEPPEPVEPPRSERLFEVPLAQPVPEPPSRAEPSPMPLTRQVPEVPEVPPMGGETPCTICFGRPADGGDGLCRSCLDVNTPRRCGVCGDPLTLRGASVHPACGEPEEAS